jgi:hypothetical protein
MLRSNTWRSCRHSSVHSPLPAFFASGTRKNDLSARGPAWHQGRPATTYAIAQRIRSSIVRLSSNARSSFASGLVPQLRAPTTDAMAIHEFGGNHSRSGTSSFRMRRRPVCEQYSAHIAASATCAVTRRLRIRSIGLSNLMSWRPRITLTQLFATQGGKN